MSKSVDKRIVSMEFDNKQFEEGAKQTNDTLDKLKNNSDFDKSGIGSALDTISSKFTNFGIVGVTALQNITNSAIDTGKNIIESMSGIEAMKAGFSESELETASVKTIMASSKQDEKTVYKYLKELNEYADDTIYSFSDMTASIGKFTNAGVDLDSAVKAIKGISNEAALSGANANEASRAMYNFAQALSSGVVRLIDWKSIENANMATVEFKQKLIDSAVAMGTLVEENGKYVSTTTDANGNISDIFDATSKFNDSLSAQWMTSEVLIDTLSKYSDTTTDVGKRAQEAATQVDTFSKMIDTLKEAAGSGWSETFRTIFGGLSEATDLWTGLTNKISDFMSESANYRNGILGQWKSRGGREDFVTGLNNLLEAIFSILTPIRKAIHGLFGDVATNLTTASKSFAEFTKKLILNEDQQKRLYKITLNIGRPIKFVIGVIKNAIKIVGSLLKALSPLTKIFSAVFDAIHGSVRKISNTVEKETRGMNIVDTIVNGILKLQPIMENFANWVVDAIHSIPEIDTSWVSGAFNAIKEFIKNAEEFLSNFWNNIQNFFSNFGSGMSNAGAGIGNFFSSLGETIKNALADFKNFNFGTVLDALQVGLLAVGIKKLFEINKQAKTITKNFSGIIEGLKDAAMGLVDVVDNFAGVLKAKEKDIKANAFLKIAAAIAILTACMIGLTLVDQDKLKTSFMIMMGLLLGIAAIVAVSMDSSKNLSGISEIMKSALASLAQSISGFLKKIGKAIAMAGLAALVVTFAYAIGTLITTIVSLQFISWDVIGNGLLKLAAMIGVLAGSLLILAGISKLMGKFSALNIAVSLMALVGAITALTVVLGILALIPADALNKAVGALAITLGVVTLSLLALSKINAKKLTAIGKAMVSVGASFSLLGIGMLLIIPSLLILSKHNVLAGIFQFSLFLSEVAHITKYLGKGADHLAKFAIGIGILAAALVGISLVAPLIIKNADTIEEAISVLIKAGLKAIVTAATEIVDAALKLIDQVLDSLIKYLPSICTKLGEILVQIAIFIKNYLPEVGGILIEAIVELIKTIADAVAKNVNPKDLLIFTGTLLALAGITYILKKIGKDAPKAIAGAALMAGVMGLIGGIIYGLSLLITDADKAIKISTALGIAMLAMALTIKTIGQIKVKDVKGVTKVMAALGLVFGEIGFFLGLVINQFTNVSPVTIFAVTGAISLAMLAMAGTLRLIANIDIKNALAASAGMALIGAVFLEVGEALSLILMTFPKDMTDSAIEVSAAIAIALDGMAVALRVLSGVPFSSMASAVGGIELFILALTATITALGALSEATGGTFDTWVGKGIDLLVVICEGLGKAVGAIIAGLAEGIMLALPGIGDSLNQFMDSMAKVRDKASGFDDTFAKNIDHILTAILKFVGTSFLAGLEEFITKLLGGSNGGIITVADNLVKVVPKIKEAFSGIAELSTEDIDKSVKVLDSLTGLQSSIGTTGGLKGIIFGETDWEGFSEAMPLLGSGVAQFASKVERAKLSEKTVESAATAAEIINTLANTEIPKTGGLWQEITGSKDYSGFANCMPNLANGVIKFVKVITDANLCQDDVDRSDQAASIINKLAETKIPETGGLWQDIVGGKDYAAFAKQMPNLATGVVTFVKIITDNNIADSDTKKAATAAEIINNLAGVDIDPSGGWWQEITGSPDYSKFAEAMPQLGTGIAGFCNNIAACDLSKDDMIDYVDAIGDLADDLIEVKNIKSTSSDGFIKALKDLATEGIGAFKDTLINPDTDTVANVMDGFCKAWDNAFGDEMANNEEGHIKAIMKNMGELSFNAYSLGFKDQVKSTENGVNTMFQTVIDEVTKDSNGKTIELVFTTLGQSLCTNITSGIKTKKQLLIDELCSLHDSIINIFSDAFNTVVNKALNMISNIPNIIMNGFTNITNAFKNLKTLLSNQMAEISDQVNKGLTDGLTGGLPQVENAVTETGGAIPEILKNILGIHSPSKKAMEIGEYITDGLAIGLTKNTTNITDASNKIANTTLDSLNESLYKLQGLSSIDMNYEPTITPVLDTSKIQNGINSMNSMFNRNPWYNGSLNINDTASTMITTDIGSSADIVKEIQGLRDELINLQNNLGNQQIIMDSGALVGSIVDKMDNALGKRIISSRRR